MKKRWVVFYKDGSHEDVENMSEAITCLRFNVNCLNASFTTAVKNFSVKIHINKKMAVEAAYLCEGEYRLPKNCKFGREWLSFEN